MVLTGRGDEFRQGGMGETNQERHQRNKGTNSAVKEFDQLENCAVKWSPRWKGDNQLKEKYQDKGEMSSMTQEELNQADYGAKGVPPSMSASLTEVRRKADSFRPKGGMSYLVG
jgi:hypothetical protein